jgi:hypothetical protein
MKGSRILEREIVIGALLDRVRNAWAILEGAESFFAPKCFVDARRKI